MPNRFRLKKIIIVCGVHTQYRGRSGVYREPSHGISIDGGVPRSIGKRFGLDDAPGSSKKDSRVAPRKRVPNTIKIREIKSKKSESVFFVFLTLWIDFFVSKNNF